MFSKYAKAITTNNKEEWLELRKTGIGGSDCSVVIGVNPYKNEYTLFKEKTGQKEPDDLSKNKAVIKGTLMEEPLRELFSIKYPSLEVFKDNKTYFSLQYPFMLANLDGVIRVKEKTNLVFMDKDIGYYDVYFNPDELIGLEIKTASIISLQAWKKIPKYYYAQLQHYMIVTGLKKFILLAYLEFPDGNVCIRQYLIKANEDDQNFIIEKETEFYNNIINNQKPLNKINLKI